MNQKIKKQAHKEFEKKFEKWIFHNEHGFCVYPDKILEHLDSLIDKTVQQERERIVEMIEERQSLFNFIPEINGYKNIKAKDLDIINLIQQQ